MERDFFKQPLTPPEIRALLKGRPVSDLFSWKSPSVKALGLGGQQLTDDQMLELMAKEPRLMRRPVVLVDGQLIIGGDVEKLRQAL